MVQAGTERSEARTYSTRCKPDQGSRRAVDERDDGRSMFLAADQWTVAFRLCKILFHAGHVREMAPARGAVPCHSFQDIRWTINTINDLIM